MTCSDVQQLLPEFIDGSGDAEFELHLKSCAACSELVGELKLIAREAHQLAESEEPPARVWVNIANQLRAEGIIREPRAVPERPVLVPVRARRWSAWWLAPVSVAILAAAFYQFGHKQSSYQAPQVAQQPTAEQPAAQPSVSQPAAPQPEVAQQTPPAPPAKPAVQVAKNHALPPSPSVAKNQPRAEVSPPASADDQQFLSEVSERAPAMRSTYENQLRAVNAEINETLEYMRRHPGDMDAHQHLLEVYQQKAMLYQMALDRIQ